MIDRKGTGRGSPDQAFSRYKGNATLDWQSGRLGASLTGCYIDGVVQTGADNRLNGRFTATSSFA